MLFLNAGTVFAKPGYNCVPASVDGIEQVFAANYLGHHLLFRLLEPALQKSKLARVVSTSSNGSFKSYSYQVATDLETLNGCSEKFNSGLPIPPMVSPSWRNWSGPSTWPGDTTNQTAATFMSTPFIRAPRRPRFLPKSWPRVRPPRCWCIFSRGSSAPSFGPPPRAH